MLTEAVIALVIAAAGVIWAYLKGKKDANTESETQDFNEYIKTRERMEAVDPGNDVDKWLRARAKRDGDL